MTTLTVEFGKVQEVRRAIAVGQVAARRDDEGVIYWLDRYAREAHESGSGERQARQPKRDTGAKANRGSRPMVAAGAKELRRTS
jgi:hypothetical protein